MVSSQSSRSVDADAWSKWALTSASLLQIIDGICTCNFSVYDYENYDNSSPSSFSEICILFRQCTNTSRNGLKFNSSGQIFVCEKL